MFVAHEYLSMFTNPNGKSDEQILSYNISPEAEILEGGGETEVILGPPLSEQQTTLNHVTPELVPALIADADADADAGTKVDAIVNSHVKSPLSVPRPTIISPVQFCPVIERTCDSPSPIQSPITINSEPPLRRTSVNVTKEKLDVTRTMSRRLEKLEDNELRIEHSLREMLQRLESKGSDLFAVEDRGSSGSGGDVGDAGESSDGNIIVRSSSNVPNNTDAGVYDSNNEGLLQVQARLSILEGFFHGYDALQEQINDPKIIAQHDLETSHQEETEMLLDKPEKGSDDEHEEVQQIQNSVVEDEKGSDEDGVVNIQNRTVKEDNHRQRQEQKEEPRDREHSQIHKGLIFTHLNDMHGTRTEIAQLRTSIEELTRASQKSPKRKSTVRKLSAVAAFKKKTAPVKADEDDKTAVIFGGDEDSVDTIVNAAMADNNDLGEDDASEDDSSSDDGISEIIEEIKSMKEKITLLSEEKVSRSFLDENFKLLVADPAADEAEAADMHNSSNPLVVFKARLDTHLDTLSKTKLEKSLFSEELTKYENAIAKKMAGVIAAGAKKSEDGGKYEELLTKVLDNRKLLDELHMQIDDIAERAKANPTKEDLAKQLKLASLQTKESMQLQMRSGLGDLHTKMKDFEKGLAERPGEEQVEAMMKTLEQDLAERFGDSRTIQIILENLKLDLRKKTTKGDVLGLVNGVVGEIEKKMALPDDSLMAGRTPVRCLSCNNTINGAMHSNLAKHINHNKLPVVSSTMSSMNRGYSSAVEDSVVLATYPNGRGGALRALQPQSSPGKPVVKRGGKTGHSLKSFSGGGGGVAMGGRPNTAA